MKILNGLQPEKVFDYFEQISAIPRGSGNTDAIRAYCADFAEKRNLEYITDESGNIIIFKPSNNRVDAEPIIIQGHLDMVWEKDDSSDINFETDGLNLFVDGDFIGAKGTTLGGDDGIAVAMCLALLDSDDIEHPPLEIIFTADEEVGMSGAFGLDTSVLKSKRMINLDSEAEGSLWVSCAGGVRADIVFNVQKQTNHKNSFVITVSNLHGGHSGAEIHNGYANANKVMGVILSELKKKCNFEICDINGGTMDNAITRDCICVISSDCDVCSFIQNISESICIGYKKTDPDMSVSAFPCEKSDYSFTYETTSEIISVLNELPNGVISMSREIPDLVETSLNLGIIKAEEKSVLFRFSVRSGKDAEKDKLCKKLSDICKKYNCEISFKSSYPAWEYKSESALRDKMYDIYREMFDKELKITAIHAGLECGLFCGKINGLDCVSLGPDMYDIHTPSERLSISSTERVWKFLLRVLQTV